MDYSKKVEDGAPDDVRNDQAAVDACLGWPASEDLLRRRPGFDRGPLLLTGKAMSPHGRLFGEAPKQAQGGATSEGGAYA